MSRRPTTSLGYPWFVSGEVEHGDRRGRELGYPTANLRLDPACGLRHGIYAVRVGTGGRRFDGVASFGRRPMFDVGTVLLEVHLFDFTGDLYGKTIDVAFIGWIRHELVFASIEELVRGIDEDARRARAMLARMPAAFPPLAPADATCGPAMPPRCRPSGPRPRATEHAERQRFWRSRPAACRPRSLPAWCW